MTLMVLLKKILLSVTADYTVKLYSPTPQDVSICDWPHLGRILLQMPLS